MLVEFVLALFGFSYGAGRLAYETRENNKVIPPELDWNNVKCQRQNEVEDLFRETDETSDAYDEMVRLLGRPFPRAKYEWGNPFLPLDMSSIFAYIAEREGWRLWLPIDGPRAWQVRPEANQVRILRRNRDLALKQTVWMSRYLAMKRRYPELDRISRTWQVYPELCRSENWYELKIREALEWESNNYNV